MAGRAKDMMNYLQSLVLVLHVLIAAALCGFVLLQHGKGADMGAAFGSGASGSLFGASGSANFLSRSTAVLATVFFVTSVGLTYFASLHGTAQGVMDKTVTEKAAPAPKASDVPQPATKPSEVPQPAPSAPGAPSSSEVPK
jgi:preprotein translocase subunit SecG